MPRRRASALRRGGRGLAAALLEQAVDEVHDGPRATPAGSARDPLGARSPPRRASSASTAGRTSARCASSTAPDRGLHGRSGSASTGRSSGRRGTWSTGSASQRSSSSRPNWVRRKIVRLGPAARLVADRLDEGRDLSNSRARYDERPTERPHRADVAGARHLARQRQPWPGCSASSAQHRPLSRREFALDAHSGRLLTGPVGKGSPIFARTLDRLVTG